MNSLKQYGTYLIITSSENICEVIKGKNFFIRFLKIADMASVIKKYKVVIEAKSIYRAQFVLDLIISSMFLLSGLFIEIGEMAVYPIKSDNDEQTIYNSDIKQFSDDNIPLYCRMAAKISFRRMYINAINKYFLSGKIHANHWVDLSPSLKQIIPLSPFPYDYLRYGYAIIIAYSIIEELKLEVRASSVKPSLKGGIWNQDVKEDLERRLKKAKINISDPVIWLRRGPRKRLEIRRNLTPIKEPQWVFGNIRDCEVLVIDAINYVSWLRSKIAAHKVDNDIKSLSVYDVSNAQRLARRLLLETLGYWEI